MNFNDLQFQSTRPQGARRARPVSEQFRTIVSIHAPARGATYRAVMARRSSYVFQSTRPQGARPLPALARYWSETFQSTRPQGARRHNRQQSHGYARFNPRARKGRDQIQPQRQPVPFQVSIHAPARGATSGLRENHGNAFVSIHAPARGATRRPGSNH